MVNVCRSILAREYFTISMRITVRQEELNINVFFLFFLLILIFMKNLAFVALTCNARKYPVHKAFVDDIGNDMCPDARSGFVGFACTS